MFVYDPALFTKTDGLADKAPYTARFKPMPATGVSASRIIINHVGRTTVTAARSNFGK
jgi:hypothetical protein